MGKYSQSISERIAHTKITQGYCLICGKYGVLTFDHVPPQGSITITKVEQRHITETAGFVSGNGVKGIESSNGSKFKTLCKTCNGLHVGGDNDTEIARVCKLLTSKIKDYFNIPTSPYTEISVEVDAIKFCRAMIGHILAATSVKECKVEPESTPYFDPLKRFVLGDDDALVDTHEMYYWFYPSSRHVSAKNIAFFNEGNLAISSHLHFFPIAFMVTEKNKGIFPWHAREFRLDDTVLRINMSSQGLPYAEFPFHGLHGNQMMFLDGSTAIVSYPVGQ